MTLIEPEISPSREFLTLRDCCVVRCARPRLSTRTDDVGVGIVFFILADQAR